MSYSKKPVNQRLTYSFKIHDIGLLMNYRILVDIIMPDMCIFCILTRFDHYTQAGNFGTEITV